MSGPDSVSPLDRVFISYAHDDEVHEQKVRQLWTYLRSRGIDARIDLPAANDRQDWPIWMLREIRSARFVLVIASPEYRRRAEGDPPAEEGRGVQWEAALIREEVYADREASLKKYLSVVLPDGKASDIPSWLGPTSSTTYTIEDFTDEGAEDLLRILTDQQREATPPIGQRPRFRTHPIVGRPQTRDEVLKKLIQRLSSRSRERSDAEIQADIRQILLIGNLGLTEDDLGVDLHNQARDRRRIDIEKGNALVEVWRDLTDADAAWSAEQGLSDYIATCPPSKLRRIAVLTDGCEWRLYTHSDSELQRLPSLIIDPDALDYNSLLNWVEAILATRRAIPPTRRAIETKLGTSSPAHALDIAELKAIYERHRHMPVVQIKRDLWAKLLTTAMGSHFTDDDSLFINHTLLAAMAKVIGHAVVGFRPEDPKFTAEVIMTGAMFTRAQITGVIEADFFNWIVDTPEGDRFIKDLARRLTRFAWDEVDRDVMKVLYESIVSPETRRLLGEYYTPDWLAREIVAESVDKPLEKRVLDASCGSGTFLFYAVRHFLTAAEAAGMSAAAAIERVVRQVIGIDVHPVAVSLARVTYLLAIGVKRLRDSSRPSFAVPVYLGDSLRWGQEDTLYNYDGLIVPTTADYEQFLTSRDLQSTHSTVQLRFPERVILDPQRFDRMISELADSATSRDKGSPRPSIRGILRRYDIHPDDRAEIEDTFAAMCKLHDDERNHIWGYYVRNLARPHLLARPDNQVDVLVGNPPWLAYRFMTSPQQASFRAMSRMRNLWTGSTVATSQQLAALFVVRCIELYLRPDGRFGFVMPHGVLSLKQYAGFRMGHYPIKAEPVMVAFDRPWDLHKVKPSFFPVPASVILGRRIANTEQSVPLRQSPEQWVGTIEREPTSREELASQLTRRISTLSTGTLIPLEHRSVSPYGSRFFQGAAMVPRFLFVVEKDEDNPLGLGAGRLSVRSRRSNAEKQPWRSLPSLAGIVESQFVRPLVLGESIMPFRCLPPAAAVIPWDGVQLLSGEEELELYPGLATWWRKAESVWQHHRSNNQLTLIQQLDYRRKLTLQLPASDYRVVYSKSGMYLAAAIVTNPTAVIDQQLYWATVRSVDEGRYLTAVMNSTTLTNLVAPLQARGEHNARHFAKQVFQFPIPMFNPVNRVHRSLVRYALEAETIVASFQPSAGRFELQRRLIRQALSESNTLNHIDQLVADLLAEANSSGIAFQREAGW